jgi:hypothetical protein
MSESSNTSWWQLALVLLKLALVLLVVGGGLTSFLLVANYPMYLSDVGNQQACEMAYGPNATYVGDTWGGVDRQGALCQTEDGIKIAESQTAPMNQDTATDYLAAVANGEA